MNTISAKKKYIVETANKLPHEDRVAVLQCISRMGLHINDCADGSRVNLNVLGDNEIDRIYGVVAARSKNVVLCL